MLLPYPLFLFIGGTKVMNFNISKFAQNIEKYNVQKKKLSEKRTGVVTVISHIWNHDYADEINFDFFSIKDAIFVMETMECIALVDTDDETFIVDPRNPFMIYKQVDDVLLKLSTSKNKVYESDDDEIFI